MHRVRYVDISSPADQAVWGDYIASLYGVRLSSGQLYVDPRSGRVYAGSEYVCQIGPTADPSDARLWTDSLAHMPRGRRGIEVAERREGLTHNYEPVGAQTCGEAVTDPSTALGRMAEEVTAERQSVIAQWVALGYTPEEAYQAALFGYRKS